MLIVIVAIMLNRMQFDPPLKFDQLCVHIFSFKRHIENKNLERPFVMPKLH